MTEQEVRCNWSEALKRWEKGEFALSGIIGWGFYSQDLLVLGILHKENKYRDSIEYLLEDCNFHYECSLLNAQEYDEYFKSLFEEYRF